MYTIIRTSAAMPGKMGELVAIFKESAALGKRLSDGDGGVVATSVGGTFGEVSLIWQVESLAAYEEAMKKFTSNAEAAALLAKAAACVVPHCTTDRIYQHL